MLTFLSCIETGLLPRGRLDPPLWSQRPGAMHPTGKRRRPFPPIGETRDFVFRIVDNSAHRDVDSE